MYLLKINYVKHRSIQIDTIILQSTYLLFLSIHPIITLLQLQINGNQGVIPWI